LAFSKWATLVFAVVLTLAAFRAYQYPAYTSDGFVYMANAVAMHGAAAPEIHDTVYREVYAGVPQYLLGHLLGNDPVPSSMSLSFHDRALNPYHFAEFLPCFAVRPIFNELVYVLHYGFGVSLLRAPVLISVLSYWLLGWLSLLWISSYSPKPWAALLSLLLVVTPPVWDLARWPMPDALSCLLLLLALYLILEKELLAVGLTILLASVYVRTDNMLLALTVIAYLSILTRSIEKTKAAALAAVAILSVFLINHFAGDYGAKLLYYRAFIATPIAPGEIAPQFGFHDYISALKSGFPAIIHGDFITFALMGLVGLLKRPGRALLSLAAITAVYSAARFLIFPLVESRYFALFFVAMGILLASSLVPTRAASSASAA